jgi:FKBP-type peptidyl-prolyl cis-trans isomerase FkpA
MSTHTVLFGSFTIALVPVLLIGGCQAEPGVSQPSPVPQEPPPFVSGSPTIAEPTKVGESVKRLSGLVYETLKEGTGPQAKFHDTVTIHYTAGLEGSKDFDSTRDRDRPATFELGNARFIQGWNEGIAGMKVGERRKLTVPPALAYGAIGRLPAIPPNGTLILDIELLAIGEPPPDLKAQSLGAKFTVPSTADMDNGVNEWVDAPTKVPEKKQ